MTFSENRYSLSVAVDLGNLGPI